MELVFMLPTWKVGGVNDLKFVVKLRTLFRQKHKLNLMYVMKLWKMKFNTVSPRNAHLAFQHLNC